MSSSIKAVVFDLDNVLYDERCYYRAAFRKASARIARAIDKDVDEVFA